MPNMGRIADRKTKQAAGLAGALFSSVQLRLLGLLFGNPDRTFHASELIRLAGSGSGATQRELKKLADAGILSVQASGNRKLYQANRQSPIFGELHSLVVKTVGLIEPLRRALSPHASNIDAAFVYGSVAKGKDTAKSDIDLMIVGNDLTYSDLFSALQEAERTLLRPVNPHFMTKSEWAGKLTRGVPFISRIQQQPKLFVFGTENELQGIG